MTQTSVQTDDNEEKYPENKAVKKHYGLFVYSTLLFVYRNFYSTY